MIDREPTPDDAALLLLDVGNTRIAVGTWAHGARQAVEHVAVGPAEPLTRALQTAWPALPPAGRRAAVASSVNPTALQCVQQICATLGVAPVLVVGRDLDPPIPADLPDPQRVGTDRLCVAAAAFERCQSACVVADFGTAVTIDLVADNGVFLGGTILPGLALSARALHEHTALLPLVEIGWPTEATPSETLGRDTVSAIRNGVFAMMVGALREITERYAAEIGKWPPLIVTGGDGQAVAARCDFVDRWLPDLCLDGLVIAYRRSCHCDDRD